MSATPSSEPTRVLFIGGLGRSGSTLLDLALGQVPGMVAVGEISYLWYRSDDDLCGCGEPFRGCPFWTSVGEAAYGGWDRIDRAEMARLRRRVDRHRNIPGMVASGRLDRDGTRYVKVMSRLLLGIRGVSGAKVVIDSTKDASSAFLLRSTPEVELRLLHLVRDSRGVAYSWTKQVGKPGIDGGAAFMDRYRPTRMAGRWLTYNALFHVLPRLGVPSIRMRYEDLIRRPGEELARSLRLVGLEPPTKFSFLRGNELSISTTHTIAGNPLRFGGESFALRLDEDWRQRLPLIDRAVVTAVDSPLLLRYGYFRRRKS